MLAVMSFRNPLAHGQLVGSRRVLRRAERVILAATLISWVRMVAVTGLAMLTAGGNTDRSGQVERHRSQDQPPGIGHEVP